MRLWQAVYALAVFFIAMTSAGSLTAEAPDQPNRPLAAASVTVPGVGSPYVSPTTSPTSTAQPSPTATLVPTATATLVPTPTATFVPTPQPTVAKPAPPASLRPPGTVPILMYHYIRVNPEPSDRIGFGLSVTPEDFAAQMQFLADRGYHTIGLDELGTPQAGDGKAIVITFDDGYADAFAEAAPVLRKHGFKATFYAITALVGQPRYMNWDQLRALAAEGHTIGSHTVTHPDLRTLKLASLRHQLEASRAELESQLGQPVVHLCYPAGKYDADVEGAAAAAGYASAVTTRGGFYAPGANPLTIDRVRVSGGMSLRDFAGVVGEVKP